MQEQRAVRRAAPPPGRRVRRRWQALGRLLLYSPGARERADLERRTTELLQRLIRFNTVNPPGNEQAAQEWL